MRERGTIRDEERELQGRGGKGELKCIKKGGEKKEKAGGGEYGAGRGGGEEETRASRFDQATSVP